MYKYLTEPNQVQDAVVELAKHKFLSLDTETNGLDFLDNDLLLVQIMAKGEDIYVIDARKIGYENLGKLLEPVISNPKITKIMQNGGFDYRFIKSKLKIEIVNIFDTMLAERCLTAGLGIETNLEALTKKYINAKLDKSVRSQFIGHTGGSFTEAQLKYAADDIDGLFIIKEKQANAILDNGLSFVAQIEFKCLPAVADMQLNGIKINQERWRELLTKAEREVPIERRNFIEMIPGGVNVQHTLFDEDDVRYDVNLNSSKQLLSIFKKMGIDLPDTNAKTLARYGNPEIKQLLKYRGLEKLVTSFGENVLAQIKSDGRIHPDFIQYGADTGRFSCSNPNVQQIPASSDFRDCFVASDGHLMLTSDYSQCELRILADLSGDVKFREAFEHKKDLHIFAASMMFGIPEEQVTKVQRKQAKDINFGLAYGMGPQGLAVRIDKTVDEAKQLIESYFQSFTGIQTWLQAAGESAKRDLVARTATGRARYFTRPDKSDEDYREKMAAIVRQGKNVPIQGTNADMTKLALIFLKKALTDKRARIVNCVHDEVVLEVEKGYEEEIKEILEKQMVRAGQEVMKNIETVAEVTISDRWKK